MRVVAAILAVCLVFVGCANYEARRLDELSASAQAHASAGRINETGDAIHELLSERPAGVNELFSRSPVTRKAYLDFLHRQVVLGEGSTPATADMARVGLERSRAAGALTPAELAGLQQQLDAAVARVNRSGAVPFDLVSGADFPVLATPEHRAFMAQRSIAALKAPYARGHARQQHLNALVEYAKANLSSGEIDRLQAELDAAGLRRTDLPTLEGVFPQLVAKWRPKLFVRGEFKLKGGDRLLEEDLRKALLERAKGLELAADGPSAPLRITVEKVRQDERLIPESRETVTYAQHQVDIGYAVMFMPRNASYLYEISRSGASIDYGYVVTVEALGAPKFEKLVRGTATGEQVRCTNQRVQNVFGGVQAADFVANSDMASRCNGGNGKSVAQLREQILSDVVDAIVQAEPVKPLVDAS